jgi:hypothetical protein
MRAGGPENRMLFVPVTGVVVLDNWHIDLRGIGSRDFTAEGLRAHRVHRRPARHAAAIGVGSNRAYAIGYCDFGPLA